MQATSSRVLAGGRRALSTAPMEFGAGGRHSVSGVKAAVFGATGFLGSYVCSKLGECGSVAYIGNRGDEMEARHLKQMFDLGNMAFYYYSGRDDDSIRQVIEGADVVINMVGKQYETKKLIPTDENGRLKLFGGSRINYSYKEVNVDIAQKIARFANELGADKLIHVSALGASLDNESEWFRTKALGEEVVRAEFPEATIVRPATLFGDEDKFLNWFAYMACRLPAGGRDGMVPLLGKGDQLVQPVFVKDVAEAIVHAVSSLPGKRDFEYSRAIGASLNPATLELAGPHDYTRREMAKFVLNVINRQRADLFEIDEDLFDTIAYFADIQPMPWVNQDEIKRWAQDIVLEPKDDVMTFKDFGMEPKAVEDVAFAYLHRYRPAGHFVLVDGYNQ